MTGAGKKRVKAARSDRIGGDNSIATSAAPHDSVFDGPPASNAGDEGRGRRLSNVPTSSSSRPGSTIRGTSAVRPVRFDPAKQPHLNRNVDYPANVYNMFSQYDLPATCIHRPGFNTSGTAVAVNINSYPIERFGNGVICQYDVLIGSGVEKRGLITAVWNSKLLQDQIGPGWVFDGNRLAWHLKEHQSKQYTIDLDVEQGVVTKPGRSNSHKVQIRPSTKINLSAIQGYLDGKMSMDNAVLQAIDFFDHLMRVTPSKIMWPVKRSFYHPKLAERIPMGGGMEAVKGIYQTIRVAHGGKLVVNVDVSNTCFWGDWPVHIIARQVVGLGTILEIGTHYQKTKESFRDREKTSLTMARLMKMRKLRFHVDYRGISDKMKKKTFIIKDFSYQNAYDWMFDYKDRETEVVTRMSLRDYFLKTYEHHLEFATLPVVETMTKGVAFPMEICYSRPAQRYPFKLDSEATARMIKFAVTRPPERRAAIEEGIRRLDWANDRYLKNYGLKPVPQMQETQARLLVPPVVQFGGTGQQKPGTSGRWRLDGQKFLLPNKKDLVAWGVSFINTVGPTMMEEGIASNFIRTFVNTYKGHGGVVSNTVPLIIESPRDEAVGCLDLFKAIVAKHPGTKPQIMVFMLSGKDSLCYERIKKSCDCRFGVVSQCMQNLHVKRSQGQYISNVLMKFNAKLGGTTARVAGKNKDYGHFKVPTMIMGADVSHAAPGSLQPSMAAVTVMMDKIGCRYAAACETNGHRVEMITQSNLMSMLTPLFTEWMSNYGLGRLPLHFYYFRDGVSEAQYQHVIQQELKYIKMIWRKLDNEGKGSSFEKMRFTVVVASKRHHIRFFPKERTSACDKNGNPCPGVLVERDVTHPFEYDFYLNSHSAIQGTARPTHYHVLLDEAKMNPTELQNMIYEHCYQYMRSTTPVSMFPAIYYAHLASKRAVCHENKPMSAGHKSNEEQQRRQLIELAERINLEGKKMSAHKDEKLRRFTEPESRPLVKMINDNQILWSMWYI